MGAGKGRMGALTLPVDANATSEFRSFRARTPLFSIIAGRVLVTLTLPERLRAEDVEFARTLAEQASAYATEVERAYKASGRTTHAARKGRAA
ncbi:hypothetical protein [Actinomadura rupiterrae]|uniref:hypothetical protein n=1 Tax=Actinomadura rupiterrae TaxID=559627 RepID=UPI0020A315FA|nr:hypothetical protein [Actinomadura rupiterrae]MCP2340584.1 hypothetical protein [Actinomadura rupiterrae]